MSTRLITIFGVIAVLIIAYVAWTRNMQQPAPGMMPSPAPAAGAADGAPGSAPSGAPAPGSVPIVESGTHPGVSWLVPQGWFDQGATSMRLSTYKVPGVGGAADGECAVYYFGPGQGGPVDANLARWQGEFKDATAPARTTLKANGISVSRVFLSGVHMAHVGMGSTATPAENPNWSLLGAIAEGPNGPVFFKLTGPTPTLKAAAGEFDKMIKSIHAS